MKSAVLIIDDDEDLCEIARVIFSGLNLTVSSVLNVVKAKEWLSSGAPRLIVLDIMMPDGNGLDMCRWIRSQPHLKDVPVLVASGLGDEETLQDALEAGATDFITKPYDYELLKEKMRRFHIMP